MNENTLQSVLLIAGIIVLGMSAIYLYQLWQHKRTQLSSEQWSLLHWILGQAVIGVEQMWRAGLIKKDDRLKKAVEIVQREVDAYGLPGMSVQRVTDLCIAAVGRELNRERLTEQSKQAPELPSGKQ